MFRLEALLKVRKNEENEEQKRFGVVNAHLIDQKKNHELMSSLAQKNFKNLDVQRKKKPDLNILWLYDNFFDGVGIQERRAKQIISEVTEKLEVCRKSLTEAMRKRKTLETLKGRMEEIQRRKKLKQEQAELDEAGANLWRSKLLQ